MTKEKLFDELPARNQALMHDLLTTSTKSLTARVSDTGLEILRQAILVNGAGIAGTTAILANKPNFCIGSLVCFCIGMALALIALIMSFGFGFKQMLDLQRKAAAILLNEAPTSTLNFTTGLIITTGIVWGTTLLSVAIFIAGGVVLIASLL